MIKTKIFYKLMFTPLIFAVLILAPHMYTINVQVNKLIEVEESFDQSQNQQVPNAHRGGHQERKTGSRYSGLNDA